MRSRRREGNTKCDNNKRCSLFCISIIMSKVLMRRKILLWAWEPMGGYGDEKLAINFSVYGKVSLARDLLKKKKYGNCNTFPRYLEQRLSAEWKIICIWGRNYHAEIAKSKIESFSLFVCAISSSLILIDDDREDFFNLGVSSSSSNKSHSLRILFVFFFNRKFHLRK